MLILFLRGNWHTNKNIFCNHEVRDLPQASLAAAFAKIYVSLQAGLLVWLPSPVLSLYAPARRLKFIQESNVFARGLALRGNEPNSN